ncbi:MAG: tRNA 4-thiouridine(8) synthase ThiI [Clostridia bacterium]|nr:tRNA 4-thiouridine(8) synthase ThiI [Clostridia bacterium]
MKKVILIRFGELFLKGDNKGYFIKALEENIREGLKDFDLEIEKQQSRYVIKDFCSEDLEDIIEGVKKVFGIYSFSVADEIETNYLEEYFEKDFELKSKVFRVTCNRADKQYPLTSTEIGAKIGGILLKRFRCKVDLHKPELDVKIDIRQNGKTYIFTQVIKGAGGMPVGTSGKALALMSGGIDSPVASVKMAQRGLKVEGIHFFSYPYTSEEAKDKVIKLCQIVKPYTQMENLYLIPFTHIQEAIHEKCDPSFMITLMRRFMAKISAIVARKIGAGALITGESLAQVASQTMESMYSTDTATDMLFLRPLVGMDKEEIIEISNKIGTFETSILPFEDCCTVFLPKRPVIKPKIEKVLIEENKLDLDSLIKEAVDNMEVVKIK